MMKYAYLTTTIVWDKSSNLVSQIINEVAGGLVITLKHATTRRHKQLACLDDLTRQLNKRWRLKQESEDQCGINTSALRSLIITLLTTHALAVSQAECFTDALLIKSQNYSWTFVHWRDLLLPRKLPKILLTKQRWSTKMFAKMLFRLLSNTKCILTKRSTLQSSKKQIMFMSYSWMQNIKGVKILLQNSGGLGRILLKKCYQTTNIWSAKLEPTRRKRFIASDCVSSYPDNHNPMCK